MIPTFQTECIFVIHSEIDNHILTELENFFHPTFYHNQNENAYTQIKIKYLDSQTGDYVGEDFGNKIKHNFDECYYYLIILTKNSRKKVWVNQEIGYGLATNEDQCLIMVDESLRGESFGFIHSNYDVQYFFSNEFHIDENGSEILKINKKITNKFGKRIRMSDVLKLDKTQKFNFDPMYEYVKEGKGDI